MSDLIIPGAGDYDEQTGGDGLIFPLAGDYTEAAAAVVTPEIVPPLAQRSYRHSGRFLCIVMSMVFHAQLIKDSLVSQML